MAGKRDYDKDGTSGSFLVAKLAELAVTMQRKENMLLMKFVVSDGSEVSIAAPIKSLAFLREYYDSVVASFPGMLAEMDT
jgi:hypothetical protein